MLTVTYIENHTCAPLHSSP